MSLLLLLTTIFIGFVHSRVFHVNPATGDISNDGSETSPLSTFGDVISNGLIVSQEPENYPFNFGDSLVAKNTDGIINPGDTILLYSGNHGGPLNIREYYNSDWITVEAAPNETPVIGRTNIGASSKWLFRGVSFSPELTETRPYRGSSANILYFTCDPTRGPAVDIVAENVKVYTQLSMAGWSQNDWGTEVCRGVGLGNWGSSGEDGKTAQGLIIRNSHIFNVGTAVQVQAPGVVIENNVIENIAIDGIYLAGLSSHAYIKGNMIKNSKKVDANHDDGVQCSAGSSGVVSNVTVIENKFVQYDDINQEYKQIAAYPRGMQGIGLQIMGVTNSIVRYNTIVDIEEPRSLGNDDYNEPYCYIMNHKDGTESHDNILNNNIAYTIRDSSPMSGSVCEENIEVSWEEYADVFLVEHPIDYSVEINTRLLAFKLKNFIEILGDY